ncbi:MAG TPA: serine/threonine-protein kinase [Polyangia bacterium]
MTFCGACGYSLRAGTSAPAAAGTGPGASYAAAAPELSDTGTLAGASLVGSMVGEYQVTGLIGEGGMGTVYSGIQPLIGKKVAIKVLKAELSRDPEVMERFLAEARAVNRIGHPNIVDVFSFGAFPDGAQYFVMEHLQGKSLSGYLEEVKPLPYPQAASICAQVFDALEAAHAHNIVHRDLKPDNIFLCDRPGGGFMVKLLDFGIAKFTDEGMMSGHTRTGVPMGTPLYMSPEQCRGRDIGPQSDIYSLGVILYELFSGTPPFVADSFYEVISAHLTKIPPPLRSVAEVPPELEAVVGKALAKDRAERYTTVAELRQAVLPILQGLAGSSAPTPVALGPAPSLSSIPSVADRAAAPPRSRTGLVVGVVAVVVLAAGGTVGGIVLTRQPPAAPPPPPPVVVQAPASQAGPVAPRTVTIQLMLNPPDAKHELFIDGTKHDRLEIEAPASKTKMIEVKVIAAGYQPFVATVRPISDMVFPVNLQKIGEPPKGGARRAAPAGGPAPGPAAPAKKEPPRVKRIEDI